MEKEVQVTVLEINGKNYMLLDSVEKDDNTYRFFSELTNPHNIQVLKDKQEDDDTYYVSLDTEYEFDYALSLLYDKYHKSPSTDQV